MLFVALLGSIASVITAVSLLLTALKLWWPILRSARVTEELARKTESLVNNQLDRQLDHNALLTRTLTAAGVPVPRSATAEADSERLSG